MAMGLLPATGQLVPVLSPIAITQNVITQTSGSGQFDQTSGAMTLVLGLAMSGQISGTATISLSTDNTIIPPIGPPVSGARASSDNSITLVGDAPIDGPPGTTHGWLEFSGTLTQFGLS